MSKTFEIQVQNDHLERLSQVRKPILAVAELIWNAVDADADNVQVFLREDALGGFEAIEIVDNGHGIPHEEAERLFSKLGGSWKKGGKRSREKSRLLHGQEGRGRLRAFGLGRVVDWDVVYNSAHGLRAFRMSMIKDTLRRVEVCDEAPASSGARRGVTVTVKELERDFRSLKSDKIIEELAQIFALYLRQYPDIKIEFDGVAIDPTTAIDYAASYSLPSIQTDEAAYPATIEIVEWRMPSERRMFFCDEASFPLDSTTPGIQAPGFSFTAYLKSDYFAKMLAENRLEIADLDTPTANVIAAAKAIMRDHFRKRASEKAAGLVAEWQSENIYPYVGEPISEIEVAERQVFNVVALNVNHYLPAFSETDEKTKRLQLRLLRHAIESGPSDLSKILTEVLGLPENKRQELAGLLDKTSLSNIISASKTIADRLEFLQGLEILVFDKTLKHQVHERTQLHRIVAENSWMFGEQYHLSVDDQSLTEVLKAHLSDKMEIEIDHPVLREDGKRGIVDLMFSRNIQLAGSEDREHLVVELKRPDVKIDSNALTQLESYAFAVAADPRFKGVPAKWVFWAISSDLDSYADRKANQTNMPRGMTFQSTDPSITIWVKTWSQLINDCRSRLKFFAEKLNYAPDRDSSMEHLKATYSKYLADLFSVDDEKLPSDAEEVSE
jgi:hypothetical protein